MKGRLVVIMLLVSVLLVGGAPIRAHAFDLCETKDRHFDLEDKFFKKAGMILSNKEELGLSDEQVNKVKELKMNTKKDLIRKDAEIEILALEIKSEMWKDPADTVAVNKLVDKKYDLKKETTKALVAGCAALKDVLTKDQKAKLKELWKKCKEEKPKCPMMKGNMKCPMMGGDR